MHLYCVLQELIEAVIYGVMNGSYTIFVVACVWYPQQDVGTNQAEVRWSDNNLNKDWSQFKFSQLE